jgi:hypothetical protein
VRVEIVTDPAELAAIEERSRQYKKTALGRIGCDMVVDAPLPLLARYVAELAAEDRQLFLNELLDSLPAEALPELAEAFQRRGRGAAPPAA